MRYAGAHACAMLAAMALAGVAHAQEAPKSALAMSKYASKTWRWSIAYPAGWTVDGKDPDVVRVRSSAENALCTVHSGAVDRFSTVDEFTDFMLANDVQFFKERKQGFSVLARRRITLANGIVGNDVLVEIGPGGKSRRVHVLADKRAFALDCEGYAKDWDQLEAVYQRIIVSFTIAK